MKRSEIVPDFQLWHKEACFITKIKQYMKAERSR